MQLTKLVVIAALVVAGSAQAGPTAVSVPAPAAQIGAVVSRITPDLVSAGLLLGTGAALAGFELVTVSRLVGTGLQL